MTVSEVCVDLIRHPIRCVIHRWHWKSATLSAIIRGGLFFATNFADGSRLATRATLVEFAICVPLVGMLAAVTQALGGAEPPWAAAIVATALLPGLAHLAEFAAHWMARTPELGTSMQVSVALSVLSTIFSLFAMRRGVMIVGGGSLSFGDDLRHLPRLVLDFVFVLPRGLARVLGRVSRQELMVSSTVCVDRLEREGVRNVWCTPFGVDSTLFDAAHHRRPVDRPRRLLYVGRLDRDKQVDLLLATLPWLLENDDVFVTVAGTGRLRSAFDQWTHPRLRYLGYVRDRAVLAALYSEHDILLAPGAYETFGLAALEAAAAGLIVVGPDRGGTGALLREMQSPFAFKAGDAEDFLATVRAALRADWRRGSDASRVLAARYGTWPDAIARLVDRYEHVLEAAPY